VLGQKVIGPRSIVKGAKKAPQRFVARGPAPAVRDVRAEQQPLYDELVRQSRRMAALVRELEAAGQSTRPVTSRGVTDEHWTMGLRVQSSSRDPQTYSSLDPNVAVSVTGIKQDWMRRLLREIKSQQVRLDRAIGNIVRRGSLSELGRPPRRRRGRRRRFRSGPLVPRSGYGWGRDIIVVPETYSWQMQDLVKESTTLVSLVEQLGKRPGAKALDSLVAQAKKVELAIRNARISSGLGQADTISVPVVMDKEEHDMALSRAYWTGAVAGFALGAAGVYLITR
jgi:hypothetical protein